jgi:predicted transcriptional regulator
MLKKLLNFIISLSKLAFFGIYISSSIVLFIPFNTATYNQYTYNNSTVYIVKNNLNETKFNISICTGNLTNTTFYLINLISNSGWYRNGVYFQYCLCQTILIAMNILENYANFRNFKLTDNYFFKVTLNLAQIIFAPSNFIFSIIDFSLPCIRYKASEDLIYLAFAANSFLATGSTLLVISIYLRSHLNKKDNILNNIGIRPEKNTEENRPESIINNQNHTAESNESEEIENNDKAIEIIKSKEEDVAKEVIEINKKIKERFNEISNENKKLDEIINETISENKENKENSEILKDEKNNLIKINKSHETIVKPSLQMNENIVDENIRNFDKLICKDKSTIEESKSNENEQQNNLINIAKEVFGKSDENNENKKTNLGEIIQTVQKSIEIIQAPEKMADLIIDISSKVNVKDLLDKGIEIGHNIENYLNEKRPLKETKINSSNEINQGSVNFELQTINDSESNNTIIKSKEEIIETADKIMRSFEMSSKSEIFEKITNSNNIIIQTPKKIKESKIKRIRKKHLINIVHQIMEKSGSNFIRTINTNDNLKEKLQEPKEQSNQINKAKEAIGKSIVIIQVPEKNAGLIGNVSSEASAKDILEKASEKENKIKDFVNEKEIYQQPRISENFKIHKDVVRSSSTENIYKDEEEINKTINKLKEEIVQVCDETIDLIGLSSKTTYKRQIFEEVRNTQKKKRLSEKTNFIDMKITNYNINQETEKHSYLLKTITPPKDVTQSKEIKENKKIRKKHLVNIVQQVMEKSGSSKEKIQEHKQQNNLINIAKEVFGKSDENNEIKKSNLGEIIQTVQKSIEIIQAPEKMADIIIDISSKVNVKDLLDKVSEVKNKIEDNVHEKEIKLNEINQGSEKFELLKVNDSELKNQISDKIDAQNLDNSLKIVKADIPNQDKPKTQTEVCQTHDAKLKKIKTYIVRVEKNQNKDPMKSCKILIIISIKYLSILILLGYFGFCLYLFGYMTIQLNGILTGLQNFGMLLNITFSFLVDFMMSSKSAKVSPV